MIVTRHKTSVDPHVDFHLDTLQLQNGRVWHLGRVASTEAAIELVFGASLLASLQTLDVRVGGNDDDDDDDDDNGERVVTLRMFLPKADASCARTTMRSTNDRSWFIMNRRPCDFAALGALVTEHARRALRSK